MTKMENAIRAAHTLGATAEQAAKALNAFGAAAKVLEEETKLLMRAYRAHQPWWRRGRWGQKG